MLRIALLLCLFTVAEAQESPDIQEVFLGTPPLELVVDPATELWFEVRVRAASEEVLDEDDPLAAAVTAARALGALFSDVEAWLIVDAFVLSAQLPEGFGYAFDKMLRVPPRLRQPGVGPARAPTAALELAQALDAAAPQWLEDVWPERRAGLEASRASLLELVPPGTQVAVFEELEDLFRLPYPAPSFPVRLATRMPDRQGVAHWIRGPATMTAVVAIEGREPTDVLDTVLHETLHVSATRAFWPPSVFTVLDGKLAAKKVRGERAVRANHILFYLFAGELVRRYADPEHVDVGMTSGFYGRAEDLVEQIQPLWRGFVGREIQGLEFTDTYAAVVAAWYAQGGEFLEDE